MVHVSFMVFHVVCIIHVLFFHACMHALLSGICCCIVFMHVGHHVSSFMHVLFSCMLVMLVFMHACSIIHGVHGCCFHACFHVVCLIMHACMHDLCLDVSHA